MPQLDTSTYNAQIFWFALCFAILYLVVSRIILPRISAILKDRKAVINSDLASAAELDEKIKTLNLKTSNLRKEANTKYQNKLEEVTKEAGAKREKMVSDLKTKIDQITNKSRSDLRSFIQKSREESESAIQKLSENIKSKLLS